MDTDFYYNSLDEKHKQLVKEYQAFFESLNSTQAEARLKAVQSLEERAQLLAAHLAVNDRPQWLTSLIQACTNYKSKSPKNQNVAEEFRIISRLEKVAKEHQWDTSSNTVTPLLDFDDIVETYRNKEVIQQLFNKLIASLEKIIASDELDSIKATEDLRRLIATLQKSKKGTFQAQIFSFEFAKTYVKNFALEWVKDTKIASVAHKAASETIDELDISMDKAKSDIQQVIDAATHHVKERIDIATGHNRKLEHTTKTPTLQKTNSLLFGSTEELKPGTGLVSSSAITPSLPEPEE